MMETKLPSSRVEPAGGKQQALYSVTKTSVRRPAVQWKQRLSSKNTQAALTFPGWSWRGMPRCSALQPVPCCRGDPPCRRCRRNWPAAGGRQSPGPGADTPEPGQTHTSWWPARPAASTSALTETQTTPLIYNTPCFHFCSDWNTNHTTYLQYPLLPLLLWLKHKPHHLFTIPPASTSALTETQTTPLIYNTPCFHFCSDWNTNHTIYLQYPLLPLLLFFANLWQRFITA